MESKIQSIVISSILAFALIAGIPAAFVSVLAQGEDGGEGGNGGGEGGMTGGAGNATGLTGGLDTGATQGGGGNGGGDEEEEE